MIHILIPKFTREVESSEDLPLLDVYIGEAMALEGTEYAESSLLQTCIWIEPLTTNWTSTFVSGGFRSYQVSSFSGRMAMGPHDIA